MEFAILPHEKLLGVTLTKVFASYSPERGFSFSTFAEKSLDYVGKQVSPAAGCDYIIGGASVPAEYVVPHTGCTPEPQELWGNHLRYLCYCLPEDADAVIEAVQAKLLAAVQRAADKMAAEANIARRWIEKGFEE